MSTFPKKIAFISFLGLCVCGIIAAQQSLIRESNTGGPAIDSKQLMADLQFLSSDEMKGRETGTPENKIAMEYIVKRFKEAGLRPWSSKGDFCQEFSFKTRGGKKVDGANVIGLVQGANTTGGSIIISAHYDHLGVRDGATYNGADDNASGTAALFALAAYFKSNRPDHTLIFVAFDAEEKGLQGARHFVSEPVVPLTDILLNINMDMISRSDKNELYVAGTFHYPELKPFLLPLESSAPVSLLFGHDRPELKSNDWTTQSDHQRFHEKKIPFIYFGVEDHPDYHRTTDDYEKVDSRFYTNSVKTILMGIIALDKNIRK